MVSGSIASQPVVKVDDEDTAGLARSTGIETTLHNSIDGPASALV